VTSGVKTQFRLAGTIMVRVFLPNAEGPDQSIYQYITGRDDINRLSGSWRSGNRNVNQ
jgi:hypothetical protein